jgi:hypothetical protein
MRLLLPCYSYPAISVAVTIEAISSHPCVVLTCVSHGKRNSLVTRRGPGPRSRGDNFTICKTYFSHHTQVRPCRRYTFPLRCSFSRTRTDMRRHSRLSTNEWDICPLTGRIGCGCYTVSSSEFHLTRDFASSSSDYIPTAASECHWTRAISYN